MDSYLMRQWIFFFIFYSFFGWCFESAYVSILKKRFVNRGFMRGPFLPLYGSGAVMMLVVSMPFQDNLLLTFFAGCAGATVLEYVTGVLMEALFKVRYWDYSNQKFNFQGQICLSSTLAWGGLTILMTRLVHPFIERIALAIPSNALAVVTMLLTIYIISDFAISFKAAMDLKEILVRMEKAKKELEHLQKRLDVIVAFNENEREEKRQERELKMDELKDSIEERIALIKKMIQEKPGEFVEEKKEEIMEIVVKYRTALNESRFMKGFRESYRKSVLKGNPGMVSRKFKEALEELKSAASEKKKK